MRKDKKQIIGEAMTDEQIRRLLDVAPPAGVDPDYHALQRAYRALRSHDFQRFIAMFTAAGHNLQARDPQGHRLHDELARHTHGRDYLAILNDPPKPGADDPRRRA